ncbi:MAG: polyprenyl synthetase family protein [Solirubrobacterales bacterium]
MRNPDHAPWREVPSFARIDSQLRQVNDLIHRSLSSRDAVGELSPLFDHLHISTGKLLRPGLVLLAGECFGPLTEEHVRVAAMVEMIHHATLLHDDVIDDGHLRRGVPTANRLWGNESAVLLGDFVLSRVFRMAADLDAAIAKVVAQTAVRVCEGELRQVMQRQNWRLSEAQYIEIIADKSASFFSGCCRLGAMLSHAGEKHVEAVSRFGLAAGIAFQMADDLLDIVGEEARTGKTGRRDVAKDKLTLAVIHLLETAGEEEAIRVQAMLESGNESRRELGDMLRRQGCLQYARQRAEDYVAIAVQSLADLPASGARDALIETSRFMADRTI